MGKLSKMIFLGSVKVDSSKRLTLIKEVAEILKVEKEDNIMFFINDGEIVIRKVLPEQGSMIKKNMAEFNDWVRKREIEISMMEDEDEKEEASETLQSKIEQMKDFEDLYKNKIGLD